jgi:uncharacterized protein (TIGR04255 family)
VALVFAEHEDVVFDHAPLVAVIAQVRFPPILSLLTPAGATGFQTLLRNDYPEFKVDQQANVAVSERLVNVERRAPIFRLRSEDDRWTVSLAADFVALETATYRDFGDFLTRLSKVLDATCRTLRPARSVRVGLRKVNEIQKATTNVSWRTMINPELLGVVDEPTLPATLSLALSELHFEDGTNTLVVRHGLHPERADVYLLDQDYSTDAPYDLYPDGDMATLLQHFSDGMTSLFHWALQREFKSTLGPQPRNAGRKPE